MAADETKRSAPPALLASVGVNSPTARSSISPAMRSFSKSSSASDNSAGPPSPANFALSTRQADKLRSRLARTSTFESEEEHAHHGHGSKPSSLVAATVSGVINWVLMFGLCCAYGMIMFSDEWHAQHRSLGVSMNLATATLLGLILALRSKIGVAIGGPDLNPVVFLAGFVEVIGVDLAHQLGLDHPAAADRRLGGTFARFLGGTSSYGTEFCTGKDLIVHAEECQSYHAQLRATVIFTTAVSSLLLAVVFLIIGRLRVARFVSYVPTCIMEAFLSCVGYKVFMYALKFCKFQPVQFIPAAVIGVLVYFLKAQHVGNPAVMIPTLLFLPLGCFYAYIYGSGMDLEEARADKLMFPEMDDVAFWSVWAETLGNSGLINIKAWAKTLPDLVIMVIVCVLDCLLKVSSTESKLPVIPDKDYEVQLYGWSNFLTAACGSSVGYMQLKFNVINFGIVGNVVDRRAGLVYAALSALCYFWTIEHFNLLPRFFLSALLFFAGAGFVAENLWGSRQFLSFREWMQILIILIVFILTEALLYAVVAGAILCCIDAIKTYTTIPCILGAPQRGGEFATYTRCDVALQVMLQHIANKWLLVVRLKGFLFFGSVQGTLAYLRTQIEEQRNLPKFRRLRYIAFDCRLLDGMDASASKDIRRLKHDAMKVGISLFWTNLQPHVLEDMQIRSILHSENEWFSEFSDCLLFVERQALDYLAKMQSRWVQVHPAFALYQQQARLQTGFEPFRDILTMDTVRHGCPWKYCSRIELKGNETVLWKPGRRGKGLMLVHSGSVGLFRSLPKDGEGFEFPIAVYQQGWFINREALTGAATQHYAVALEDGQAICWNERDFFSMTRQRPSMAAAISKAVMRQQVHDGQMLDRQSQNERGVDATASMTAGGEAVTVQVPDQLEYRVDAFQTASWLQSYGLFDSPSELASADTGAAEAPLPVLPTQFENDLREAFHVYRDSVSEPHHLPKDMVRNALLYAGVTNAVLENESFVDPTADEFLHIANDAVMARFSEQQLETIRKVFAHFDDDDSGFLDASELHEVLRKTFHPTISIEEIDAISSFWDNDGSGKIELEEFSDIIARFVRHLEQEWSVLRAFQEISGRGVEEMRDSWGDWWLTVDMVRDQTTLSESDVEELFWAAGLDPRTSAGSEGPRLLLRDALVALLVDARGSSGRLPPLPLKKGSKPVAPLKATPVLGFVRNSPKRGHAGSPKRNQQRTEPVSPLSAPPDFADVPEELRQPPDLADLSFPILSSAQATFKRPDAPVNGATPRPIDGCKEPLRAGLARVADLRRPETSAKLLEATKAGVTGAGAGDESAKKTSRMAAQLNVSERTTASELDRFDESADDQRCDKSELVASSLRLRLYRFLHRPYSSVAARIWSLIVVMMVILCLLVLFLEPILQDSYPKLVPAEVWLYFEIGFTAFFLTELILRFAVADAAGTQTHYGFVTDITNVCDLIACLPLFFELFIVETHDELQLLRINRLARAMRILRIHRHRGGVVSGVSGAVCAVIAVIWGIYLKHRSPAAY